MPPTHPESGFPFDLSVTSPTNPRVKDLVRLRRRRHRRATDATLVEGFEELRLAVAAGVRPRTVLRCPELAAGSAAAQADLLRQSAAAGAEIIRVTPTVFEKLAYRQSPDGWLAVLPAVTTDLAQVPLRPDSLLLVCESVEKPGNLGAMLRTADAAGLDAVIAAGPVTDWGNPNLVRASKGALFTVAVGEGTSDGVLAWLRGGGITVVAATPHSDQPYTAVDLTGPTAIVVGSEQDGLSTTWIDGADERVHIPMFGRVDSLNVATAAALIVYEAVRQRAPVDSRRPPTASR